MLLLTRVGFLALAVAVVFSAWRITSVTPNPEAWYFPQSVATVVFFCAVALYGFWISMGDQKLFSASVLD